MSDSNLQIIPFDSPKGNQKKEQQKKPFIVDFNPNTFTVTTKIDFKNENGKGKTGGDPQFDKIAPLEFSIEFTIDGTGVASQKLTKEQKTKFDNTKSSNAPNQNDYVKNRIKELRHVVTDINPSIHRPYYLAVLWGTFYINCILISLTVTYSLFDENGSPLRAKVNLAFRQRKESEAENRETSLESADLTKSVSVKEGDLLPLLAKANYDSSAYYLQLAKVNKLKNFRALSPGTKLIIPPLAEKNDE
jgi:nucleoid-associated protein YgaU